jgi:glycogen(starch) synthase
MRVLHLLDHSAPRRSDYSRRTQALLQGLRMQGVQTVQLTGPAHGGGDAPGEGWHSTARRRRMPALPFIGRPGPGSRLGAAMSTAALALRLRQVAKLTRPDLIHVHLPSANALAAWPVARLAKIPLWWWRPSGADRQRQPSHSRVRSAGPWRRPGDCGRQRPGPGRTARRGAGREDHRRDSAGARPGQAVPAPRMPDLLGAPLLAYAGGLEPDDGLDLLLAAMAQLRREHPALRLLIAAGGPAEARFERRLAQPSLRGYVVFAGPLSYRRAADVLPRADIAVFPALGRKPSFEPSRHLLNALAQGCAVVASDLACHRELLVHGHSGILFEAGNRAALVKAIQQLLAEPWRIDALARRRASS